MGGLWVRVLGISATFPLLGLGLGLAFAAPVHVRAPALEDPEKWFDYRSFEGHQITVLPDGASLTRARLELIDGARVSIYVSGLSFKYDEAAREIADRLCAKARAGLDVRIFVDHRSSKPLLKHAGELRACGAHVLSYDPLHWGLLYFRQSLHDKLLIVDGLHYITGGSGYANWYREASRESRSWHDLNIRVSGPSACWYHHKYQENWANTVSADEGRAVDMGGFAGCEPVRAGNSRVYPLLDNPMFSGSHALLRAHLMAIRASRTRIRLYSPYFIPHNDLIAALLDARKRHVEVTILTNSPASTDEGMATLGMFRKIHGLLKAGVKIQMWTRQSMLHRKGGVYDDRWAYFGSDNLDRGAHVYNSEDISFTDDPGIVGQLNGELDLDLESSVPLTRAAMNTEVRHHSVWRHLLISLVSRWL